MSLKAFHIVFIAASILLAFGFSAWAFVNGGDEASGGLRAYAIGSAVMGAVLIGYGVYVLRKLRNVSYL
ncbi:MAG: hypothetical protein QOF48_3360 [Verrucomicrobiota bacterium]|jgi:multisubunit Na+/H+ antiporter MnhB subunit